MRQEKGRQENRKTKRRVYRKPTLTDLGEVTTMTAGGSRSASESNRGNLKQRP